jgi:hypothetical protein
MAHLSGHLPTQLLMMMAMTMTPLGNQDYNILYPSLDSDDLGSVSVSLSHDALLPFLSVMYTPPALAPLVNIAPVSDVDTNSLMSPGSTGVDTSTGPSACLFPHDTKFQSNPASSHKDPNIRHDNALPHDDPIECCFYWILDISS